MAKNNWTREEHIVAFNLYCKVPFTKINSSNKEIKQLASIIGRSMGSVAMKLANFARLDPTLRARNISGLTQGAKGEEEIWNEFNGNWEDLAFESEQILARYKGIPIEAEAGMPTEFIHIEGREREALVKLRVNQGFFRKTVLASYNSRCCITGIDIPELLVAGHIIPWSANEIHRMNPANGICLNAIHDRAFDKGLITVTPDYIVQFSDRLISSLSKVKNDAFFLPFEGKKIAMSQKFSPLQEFLEYHNKNVFLH